MFKYGYTFLFVCVTLSDMKNISEHLASHVESRRKQLGFTPTSLASETGLTLAALKNIRRGDIRAYQERLTVPLCRALQWRSDSIDLLLAGQEPVELTTQSEPEAQSTDSLGIGELAKEVRRLVDRFDALEARIERSALPEPDGAEPPPRRR